LRNGVSAAVLPLPFERGFRAAAETAAAKTTTPTRQLTDYNDGRTNATIAGLRQTGIGAQRSRRKQGESQDAAQRALRVLPATFIDDLEQ